MKDSGRGTRVPQENHGSAKKNHTRNAQAQYRTAQRAAVVTNSQRFSAAARIQLSFGYLGEYQLSSNLPN